MRIYFSLILLILLISCSTTKKYDNVISGKFTWEEWKQNIGINEYMYLSYSPDSNNVELLKKLVQKFDNLKFIVFATSYCDDCKDNLPIIFKIFEEAKISMDKIQLFGLDEEYQEPTGTYKQFYIDTAPCLFIVNNDKTMGHIQGPKYNWLEGMIEILGKQ